MYINLQYSVLSHITRNCGRSAFLSDLFQWATKWEYAKVEKDLPEVIVVQKTSYYLDTKRSSASARSLLEPTLR